MYLKHRPVHFAIIKSTDSVERRVCRSKLY